MCILQDGDTVLVLGLSIHSGHFLFLCCQLDLQHFTCMVDRSLFLVEDTNLLGTHVVGCFNTISSLASVSFFSKFTLLMRAAINVEELFGLGFCLVSSLEDYGELPLSRCCLIARSCTRALNKLGVKVLPASISGSGSGGYDDNSGGG